MTFNEYKAYFSDMLKAEEVNYENLDDLVENGIRNGIQELMGASNWTFKQYVYTLAVTATAESYNLPDNFEGFISVREEETQGGKRLVYKPKAEFDKLIPKQSTYASGNPQMFTIYRDQATSKHKIAFYPRPSGAMSIYILYEMDCQDPKGTLGKIPTRAHAALEACMAKHCYPYGHPGRLAAAQLAEREIKKLEIQDKYDMSDWTQFEDATAENLNSFLPPYWAT